jgi:hypothetical protein
MTSLLETPLPIKILTKKAPQNAGLHTKIEFLLLICTRLIIILSSQFFQE